MMILKFPAIFKPSAFLREQKELEIAQRRSAVRARFADEMHELLAQMDCDRATDLLNRIDHAIRAEFED